MIASLPAGMIPVAGYKAIFRDERGNTQSLPVIALQAADLPGDPPVAVCIGAGGGAFPATDTSKTPGWTLVGVVATQNTCYCAA